MKRIHFIMTLFCILIVSCGKDPQNAALKINDVTEITANSAKVICEITDDGGAEVTSRGLCYSTTENPDVETGKIVYGGKGFGVYECVMKDLKYNTTYYVRAYANNSAGRAYSEVKSFKTNDIGDNNFTPDGNINGYTYVDLGLPSRVKWASYNIGTTAPHEAGDSFQWGETTPHTIGSPCSTYWLSMTDISGNSQYDAATANWGDSWRMPTKEEMKELRDKCIWTWMNNGYKVTGPNGHSIFLPYSSHGMYWSSTPYEGDQYVSADCNAYYLSFDSYLIFVTKDYRDLNMSIRPVTDK